MSTKTAKTTQVKKEVPTKVSICKGSKKIIKDFTFEVKRIHENSLEKIEKRLIKQEEETNKSQKKVEDLIHNLNQMLIKQKKQWESLEESLLHIYTNIKQNQFLFAYHPEEFKRTEYASKLKKILE